MDFALYGLISLIFLFGIIKSSPAVAVSAILCVFGWEQLAQSQNIFFLNYSFFTNVVVGAFVALGATSLLWQKKTVDWDYPKIGWWVVLLYIFTFLSTFWSPSTNISLDYWYKNIPYIFSFVLVAPLLIRNINDVKISMFYFSFTGAIIVFFLFFTGKWDGRLLLLLNKGSYALNVYGNPLQTAYMAGNIIFSSLLLTLKKRSMLKELIRWVLILVSLLLIIRTGSRGQLIAVLIIMPLLHLLNKRKFSFTSTVSVVFFTIFISLITSFAFDYLWAGNTAISSDGISRFSQEKMALDMFGRFYGLGSLFKHWLASPITMLFGLGNSAAFDPKILGFYPHFVPGEIICEEGLIGFLIFMLIIIGTFNKAYRAYLSVIDDDQKRSALLFFGACYIYALFLSFKQGNLLGSTDLFMFSIILNRLSQNIIKN